jgi:hypothetical protein
MRKINTLFNENSQLSALAKNVQAHQNLQRLWRDAAPQTLSQTSFASSLTNGQLTVYADSAVVASKIKLTHATLLTKLQNLQKTDPFFRECKVTAIMVKVQVKSRPKTVIRAPRRLSTKAAANLKQLAQDLGESPLALRLKSLASKA